MKVSFEFDGVLDNSEFCDTIFRSENCNEIFIVSKRNSLDKTVIERSRELGIPDKNVFLTNSYPKIDLLKWIGISKHYDSDESEFSDMKMSGIDAICVNI